MKNEVVTFCLLLYNYLSEVNSSALKQIVEKQNTNSNQNMSLSKRQLGYGIDGDTSEIFGAIDEGPEFVPLSTTPLAKQTASRLTPRPDVSHSTPKLHIASRLTTHEVSSATSRLVESHLNSRSPTAPVTESGTTSRANGSGCPNCTCTAKKSKEENHLRNLIEKYGIKLLPKLKPGSFLDDSSNKNTTERIPEPKVLTTTRSSNKLSVALNETHFELQEDEFETSIGIKEVCPFYKHVPELDIEKMVDVWQLVYYRAKDKLTCFKIFIKKTTPEGRKRYSEQFSTFNDTINWKECFLELNSIETPREDRKHFLQGSTNDKGILENIVLSERTENDTKTITLQEQTPDQWMVRKNLLLMRDCDNGDVIIFSRLPFQSSRNELEEAMNKFGENGLNGTMPCVGTHIKENWFDETKRYETLS